MSTGNGVIPPHNGNGVPGVGQGYDNWMSLALTTKTNAGYNSAAKIKAYYFDGSVGIEPSLVGNVALEMGPVHMGYPAGTNQDIDAMDFGLGVMTFGLTSVSDQFVTVTDKFYFSVTEAWATASGANFYVPEGTLQRTGTANPGDIYEMTWTPTSAPSGGVWSEPRIYRSSQALLDGVDLNGASPSSFDVDMIAIDYGHGTTIFSATTALELPNQLMIHQGVPNHPAEFKSRVLKATPTVTVTDRSGIGNNGDVNGGCATDPEINGNGALSRLVGYSSSFGPESGLPMGLSVSRAIHEGPVGGTLGGSVAIPFDYVLETTGWGANSQAADEKTYVAFYMRPGPLTSTPGLPTLQPGGNGWVLMDILERGTAEGTVSLVIPAVAPITGTAGLSMMSVMYDRNTYQPLAYSWVTEIKL